MAKRTKRTKRTDRPNDGAQRRAPDAFRLKVTEKAYEAFFTLGHLEPLLGESVGREVSSLWELRQSGTVALLAPQIRILAETHLVRYAFSDDNESDLLRAAAWAVLLNITQHSGLSKIIAEQALAGKIATRAEMIFEIAYSLHKRHEYKASESIQLAIKETLERGICRPDVTGSLRSQYLVFLASMLMLRADSRTIYPLDMIRAEQCCREALEQTEQPSLLRANAFANLGDALMAQASDRHSTDQANEAIIHCLSAYNLAMELGRKQIEMSIKLSTLVLIEKEYFGTSSLNMRECCTHIRTALHHGTAGPQIRARALSNLGLCLAELGEYPDSERNPNDETTNPFRAALDLVQPDSDIYVTLLVNLAGKLLNHGRTRGEIGSINAGLDLLNAKLKSTSLAYTSTHLWNNYAQLLTVKANLLSEDTFELSIKAARRAVELATSPKDEFAALLTLADSQSNAYERTRSRIYAESALNLLPRLRFIQSQSNLSTQALTLFANLLTNLSDSVGNIVLLSEGIDLHRGLVAALKNDARCKARLVLADALRKMYLRTMESSYLQESYRCAQKALAKLVEPEIRWKCLLTTGLILQDMSALSGDVEPLLGAMTLAREVLNNPGISEEERLKAQNNLGIALRKRHEADGDSSSLSESIRILRICVDRTPEYDRDLPARLGNLANALLTRVRTTRSVEDAEDALKFAQRGLAGRLLSQNCEVNLLLTLSLAMSELYHLTGTVSYIEDAISHLHELLRYVREQGLPEFQVLTNLSSALVASMTSETEGLERKVFLDILEMQREAAALAEEVGSADVSKIQVGQARLLWAMGKIFGDREALVEAESLTDEILSRDKCGVSIRISAYELRGELAAERSDFANAARFYGEGVELLTDLAWPGLDFVDRHIILDQFSNLSRDAAACAISSKQIERAVELLETGRGVLLSQMLGTDVPRELSSCPPMLVQKLSSLKRALHILDYASVPSPSDPPFDAFEQIRRRTALLVEHEKVLREIRSVRGLEKFGVSVHFDDLLRGLSGRKVAIINISRYRCDALLIVGRSVHVVPLPQLQSKDVDMMVDKFLQNFAAIPDEISSGSDAQRKLTARSVLVEMLDWLWQTVGEPLIGALKDVAPSAGELARLWWCPTGRLALLPVHAASSIASVRNPGNGESLADHVVGSYAPTIRSLLSSEKAKSLPAAERSLLVCVPTPPGLPALKLTEVSSIKGVLPSVQELTNSKATRDSVLQGLADATWVHFAGHAVQDLTSPELSSLLLYEEELTVRDLARERTFGSALMFLSACSTAQSGLRSPDESLSLTSAALLCGFAHVVGTKWPVADSSLATIAELFYQNLQTQSRGAGVISADSAAAALHKALLVFRRQSPLAVTEWAAAIHIGL